LTVVQKGKEGLKITVHTYPKGSHNETFAAHQEKEAQTRPREKRERIAGTAPKKIGGSEKKNVIFAKSVGATYKGTQNKRNHGEEEEDCMGEKGKKGK